jgi:hypothetical protein
LFVNLIRAVMPSGAGAARESWSALASGFAGGVGPEPPLAATAIAPTPAASAATAKSKRSRREVERVRRNFMRILFRRLGLELAFYPRPLRDL